MANSKITGVRIAGIACAVPEQIRTIADDAKVFGEEEVVKISKSTGVKRRYIASAGLCTSDLCFVAAERLLTESGWSRDSIDALILVTQTPDYIIPATSCILQDRLKLSKQCAAFDVNLGCSGYVHGLWLASSLITGGGLKRILLLVGDTSNKDISPLDRSSSLLFGDSGTATAIERCDEKETIAFVLGTDGSGYKNLIIPAGGYRLPRTKSTAKRIEREGGNIRSDEDLYMNGPEIFTFTLREVKPMITKVLEISNWVPDSIDFFVFHQANLFIIDHLAKRMKIPKNKVPTSLEKFGNTSSASIPVTMAHVLAERLRKDDLRLVLAGFGVGYSWGAVALTCGHLVMPDLILVPDKGEKLC